MIRKQTLDRIRALPHGKTPYRDSDDIDTPINLYSGPLEVDYEGRTERCNGSVIFRWLPSPTLRFVAAADVPLRIPVTVRIPSQAFVATGFASSHSDPGVSGVLNGNPRLGLASDCKEVWFELANFHDVLGESVRFGPDTHPVLSNTRLTLPSRQWQVTIDQVQDYGSRVEELDERSGFAITHTGCFRRLDDGVITVAEADHVLSGLHFFLSFANGTWCTPIFPRGMRDDRLVWEQTASWRTAAWSSVASWFPTRPASAGSAWTGFIERWADPKWQEPLTIAIHWYIEANSGAGGVEGGIVLVQTALELLATVVLVEDLGRFQPALFDRLPAATKLKYLLNELDIPETVPQELEALHAAARTLKMPPNPEVIVAIRNGIIHANITRRKQLERVAPKARWEALRFGLWCVEMVLLHICDYNGVYSNRLTAKWVGEESTVPWVK